MIQALATLLLGSAHAAPDPLFPPPQRCLPEPVVEEVDFFDDYGVFASSGLSPAQINRGLEPHLRTLGQCLPAGAHTVAELTLDLDVSCGGRLNRVTVPKDTGLPPGAAECIADRLRWATFSPHQLPDGFPFQYRLHLDVWR